MMKHSIQSCLFLPSEVKALAAGDSSETSSLQRDICPGLSQRTSDSLQRQFSAALGAGHPAMAYLWRGKAVSVIRADRSPVLDCQNSATPLRCEAVLSAAQGQLSHLAADAEEKAFGISPCDWRQNEQRQNQDWVNYYKQHSAALDLLGTMTLVTQFFRQSHIVLKNDATMRDMQCWQEADCNIISTRVLDLLWQVGVSVTERVEVVEMTNHTTLRIQLESGAAIYFNNGYEFLPADSFNDRFLQVITVWQSAAGHHNDIGARLYEEGDLAGAMAAYHRALSISPKYTSAHLNLGAALYGKGDLNEAIASYRKALEFDSRYVEAYSNLCAALYKKGDRRGAMAACRRALEIDPKFAMAYNNLGIMFDKKGDWEVAAALYRKALECNPRCAEAHNNLGEVLRQTGDLNGAIFEYRRALEVDPRYVGAHVNLAATLYETGDRKGGIAAFRRALEIDPNNDIARHNLALILAPLKK